MGKKQCARKTHFPTPRKNPGHAGPRQVPATSLWHFLGNKGRARCGRLTQWPVPVTSPGKLSREKPCLRIHP